MSAAEHGTAEKTRVFLSYSRADEAAVIALAEELEESGEVEVFRDKEDILPAEEWRVRLEALIGEADTVVFCLSPDSAASEVCGWEIETAERLAKRIVPVLLRPVAQGVPERIARLNYILLTEGVDRAVAIGQLKTALDADIGWLHEHTRLGGLAQRWEAQRRRTGDLLRGAALDTAEDWLAQQPQHAPSPTPLHREFITASRRAATRRQRGWIIGLLFVLGIVSVLGLLAYWQRGVAIEQRTHANAGRLTAEAQVVLSDPLAAPEQAVRNLLISLTLAPSDEARHALKTGVNRLNPRPAGVLPWPADAQPVLKLDFSPDGAWLGAVTRGEALFFATKTQTLAFRHPLSPGEARAEIAFAPGTAHALITLRSEPGVEAAPTRVLIDLAGRQAKKLPANTVLDTAVTKAGLRALQMRADPAELEVIDLVGGSSVWTHRAPRPLIFGRFLTRMPEPGAILAFPFSPMMERHRRDALVLIDKAGGVELWDLDGRRLMTEITLPEGSVPLEADGSSAVLAIRRADGTEAVIGLYNGRVQWEAPGSKAQFLGFARGGRFVWVKDVDGLRFESLAGGMSVQLEHSRSTDFDISAMTDLARYTPVIGADAAADGDLVFTAWKDGRIGVWRPGQRPRYGSWGGIPMPSFELVAHFDHGETFGATATWTAPPAINISPSGRFVASQSLGIETNPVGGIRASNPLIRIWDTRRQDEIARFRPGGPMLVAFAPSDDLAATLTVAPSESREDGPGVETRLALWDLTALDEPRRDERMVGPRRDERVVEVPLPIPPEGSETPAEAATWRQPGRLAAPPIWVGMDRRLRMLDPATDKVVLIDDLGAVAAEVFAEVRTRVEAVRQGSRMKDCDPLRGPARKTPRLAKPRFDRSIPTDQSGFLSENRNR